MLARLRRLCKPSSFFGFPHFRPSFSFSGVQNKITEKEKRIGLLAIIRFDPILKNSNRLLNARLGKALTRLLDAVFPTPVPSDHTHRLYR